MSVRHEQMRAVESIAGALRLSAPVLVADPTRLAGQLAGRLTGSEEPGVGHFLDDVRSRAARPWLCPLGRALASAGGALQQILSGHDKPVSAVTVTPDGRGIVSGGQDGHMRIWDLATGLLLREWKSDEGGVTTLALTPDGRLAVGWCGRFGQGRIQTWDVTSGRLSGEWNDGQGGVAALALTPDGRSVVSGGNDGSVRVWDLASGRLERELKVRHSRAVLAVAVSPDGDRIVTGGEDETVRVTSLSKSRSNVTLQTGGGKAHAVAVSPDGSRIVAGTAQRVLVWRGADCELEHTLEGHYTDVFAVAISTDGVHVFSGGGSQEADNKVRVWDLAGGQLEGSLVGHLGPIRSIVAGPGGAMVVSGSDDGTVRVWDIRNIRAEQRPQRHDGPVEALKVSPDGSWAVSGGKDHTVRIWHLPSEKMKRTLRGHAAPVCGVDVSSDGARIVSGSEDGSMRVWDSASGRSEHRLEGTGRTVRGVAVAGRGDLVISTAPGKIDIRSAADGDLLSFIDDDRMGVEQWGPAIAVTPDGTRIVLGSWWGGVGVFDLEGRLHQEMGDKSLNSSSDVVAVTPDGAHVVSSHMGTAVRLWDIGSGTLERTYEGLRMSAITPDGAYAVCCSSLDDTLIVWDVHTGEEIAEWVADPGIQVSACCTVPTDSSLFVYGDSTGAVHILRLLD